MTDIFKFTAYLFSCSALGVAPCSEREFDLPEIIKIALSQGIAQNVFASLKQLYNKGQYQKYSDHIKTLDATILASVMLNSGRADYIHKAVKEFERQGIKYAVLKGDTVARLYKNPDLRISGDTDIYVDKSDEKKAAEILKKLNFKVEKRYKTSHHTLAKHEKYGLVELHTTLYDELFIDVWFDNKTELKEDFIKSKNINGQEIYTLSINDGALFIAMHLIKHFLEGGVGIRQLMDTLLYLRHYKNEIDFEGLFSIFNHLNYKKFMDSCITIGIKYLGFNREDFPNFNLNDSNLCDEILNDMETGGVFGDDETARHDFYKIYNKLRFGKFKCDENYKEYMDEWVKPKLMTVIFINKKTLKLKFPYYNKHAFLYPIALVHGWIDIILRFISKKKKLKDALTFTDKETDNVEKRIQLIKDLDMI